MPTRRPDADYPGAEPCVPPEHIEALAAAAPACHGGELHRDATQAVMRRGHATAGLTLVGEQPGDSEDRQGKPFVGPAGRLLVGAALVADLRLVADHLT